MNSDGLTGYRFSHEGWWSGDYTLALQTDTARKCAAECDKDDKCIAFNYQYGYNKYCGGYHSLSSLISTTDSRAYIKCAGKYKQYWPPYYISKWLYKNVTFWKYYFFQLANANFRIAQNASSNAPNDQTGSSASLCKPEKNLSLIIGTTTALLIVNMVRSAKQHHKIADLFEI